MQLTPRFHSHICLICSGEPCVILHQLFLLLVKFHYFYIITVIGIFITWLMRMIWAFSWTFFEICFCFPTDICIQWLLQKCSPSVNKEELHFLRNYHLYGFSHYLRTGSTINCARTVFLWWKVIDLCELLTDQASKVILPWSSLQQLAASCCPLKSACVETFFSWVPLCLSVFAGPLSTTD